MEDTYEVVLRWPHTDAKEVVVSGDFDQWSNSIHLVKDESGFAATIKIPWGAKVEYKFLVDGQWKTSDVAPIETDPSGKYTNNVYTAPPKPTSIVSSAISYVASGLGTASQILTGTNSAAAEEVSEASAETPTKDLALAETTTGVAPTAPVSVVPVKDTISPAIISKEPEQGTSAAVHVATPATAESEPSTASEPIAAPEPEQAAAPEPESIVAPAAPEPEQVAPVAPVSEKTDTPAVSEPNQTTSPAVPEPEASTHAPVSFSKTGSLRNGSNGDGAPTPPTPSASEPVTGTLGATDDKAKNSAGLSNLTQPSPTLTQNDEKAGTGGKALPTGDRAALTKKEKHAFPGSVKDEGDRISSRTGSSSLRKKRHSIFGGASEVDDGDASRNGTIPRKKTRSFFGKVKHLFEKD